MAFLSQGRTGVGHGDGSYLVEGNHRAIRVNSHSIEESHIGSAGTDAYQLLFEIHRCHLHTLFGVA